MIPLVPSPGAIPESFWGSLRQLNAFRVFLVVFFVAAVLFVDRFHLISQRYLGWFLGCSLVYGLIALFIAWTLHCRQPRFGRQLGTQLGIDIVLLTVLMHLGGGNDTGFGLLMIVPLSAAGMHPRWRMMLLMPALATLAVLSEQALRDWFYNESLEGYFRAGLLSVGFFTVATLSHILAKGVLSATHLASERAQAVADLEKINAKVIQDLPYGVVVVDGEGRVLQSNSQALGLLACSQPTQSTLGECVPPLAQCWQRWRDVGAEAITAFESPLTGRRLRARMIELEPTRDKGAVIVIEDLSEIEDEARRLKLAALGRLTANLAHEIRNPLSSINHAAQLLGEDSGDPGTRRLTRIIEDNVSRLNWLVEDVLALSRRDRLDRETLSLSGFLIDFLQEFIQKEKLGEGLIEMTGASHGVADEVCFDRMHLHQIFWNLMRNALRHASGVPGSIRLVVSSHAGQVLCDVFNDGPPIPSEMQQRLFEPFFTTVSSGTGLGLHIGRELAEANEAQLRCIGQNQGALFRLTCKAAPC